MWNFIQDVYKIDDDNIMILSSGLYFWNYKADIWSMKQVQIESKGNCNVMNNGFVIYGEVENVYIYNWVNNQTVKVIRMDNAVKCLCEVSRDVKAVQTEKELRIIDICLLKITIGLLKLNLLVNFI